MTAIEVPLIAGELQIALQKVIEAKCLEDDIFWRTDIRPALSQRITDLKQLLEASQAPTNLVKSLDFVQNRIDVAFSNGAPFTIHRLAELILFYRDSGYDLDTPQQAQKYVDALKKVVLVLSKESEFEELPETDELERRRAESQLSTIDYQGHKLPTNVSFVEISWGAKDDGKSEVAGDPEADLENSNEEADTPRDDTGTPEEKEEINEQSEPEEELPPSKKPKIGAEDEERDRRKSLLSPLPEGKNEAETDFTENTKLPF